MFLSSSLLHPFSYLPLLIKRIMKDSELTGIIQCSYAVEKRCVLHSICIPKDVVREYGHFQ